MARPAAGPRGSPEAGPTLVAAWERTRHEGSQAAVSAVAAALVEWFWLVDEPSRVATVLDQYRAHAARPLAGLGWEELARYAARAGVPAGPDAETSGPREDWRAAAGAWEAIGDPYERALALAHSGEVEPTLQALYALEDLGAGPAARVARRRLRDLGVHRLPCRRRADSGGVPGGLTARQFDVLTLLADGLTNAEIADRLVVSVRTVDSHVAAVLTRLGVGRRRDAATMLRDWDSTVVSPAGASGSPSS